MDLRFFHKRIDRPFWEQPPAYACQRPIKQQICCRKTPNYRSKKLVKSSKIWAQQESVMVNITGILALKLSQTTNIVKWMSMEWELARVGQMGIIPVLKSGFWMKINRIVITVWIEWVWNENWLGLNKWV